jgi:hypothetical protein
MLKARELLDRECWATTKQAQHYVVDPQVGTVPLSGTWRGVSTRLERPEGDEAPGIYLTLRRGWATTLADVCRWDSAVADTTKPGEG